MSNFCLKIPSTQIKTPLYTLHPKVLAYPDFLIKVILGVNYLYSDSFFFLIGTIANDMYYQAYLLEGIVQWKNDRAQWLL